MDYLPSHSLYVVPHLSYVFSQPPQLQPVNSNKGATNAVTNRTFSELIITISPITELNDVLEEA